MCVPESFSKEHSCVNCFRKRVQFQERIDSLGFVRQEEVIVLETGSENEIKVSGVGVV